MRTLFLHIGPPKTGTSAVQFSFSRQIAGRVIYPRVGLWADGSHHNLVFNYFGDYGRPEVERGDVRAWMRQIGEAAASQSGNLLISSEALIGRDVTQFLDGLLAEMPAGERWTAKVLFACREHFERAASLYNQAVKDPVALERSDPDAYLARTAPGLRYTPYLRELRDAGLAVTAINYHPAETFVPRFLAHVGVADPQPGKVPQRNISLSVKALVATLAANRVARSRDERIRYFQALRKMRPMYGRSQHIFAVAAMREVDDHFRADRALLAQEFGVQLPEPDLGLVGHGRFFISQGELDEIAGAVADLGPEGAAIVDGARAFLRA